MVKNMHEKQILNLLSKPAVERYEYFIRYCADFERVWGLVVGDDNWVIFKDNEGENIFPIWPHPDLAITCCFEEHRKLGAKPQSIALDSFIKNCIPDMVSDGVVFGVFYDEKREGVVVGGDDLKSELEREVRSVWE